MEIVDLVFAQHICLSEKFKHLYVFPIQDDLDFQSLRKRPQN